MESHTVWQSRRLTNVKTLKLHKGCKGGALVVKGPAPTVTVGLQEAPSAESRANTPVGALDLS